MNPPLGTLSLAALVFFAVLGQSFAAPLELKDVLNSVKATFPSIEAAKRDVDSAAADTLSANGGFDLNWRTRAAATPEGYYRNRRLDTVIEKPTALWGTSLFAGYRLGAGDFALYDGKLDTQSGGEFRVGIEVPLIRNGPVDRRRANLWRAEAGEKIAKHNLHAQSLESLRTAGHRYWDWVAAEHKLRIMEALLALATARDEQLQKRAAHGDIPRIEIDENTRAILQREAQLIAARRLREQAAIELSLYLRGTDGRPALPAPAQAPARFPEPTLPEDVTSEDALPGQISAAQSRRPDVARIALQRDQNEFERRWATNQVLPRLDAQAWVSRDLGRPETTLRPTEVEGAIVMEIPLQTRAASGRADAAAATAHKLDAIERLTLDRVANEIRDSIIAMRAANERVAITRREVTVAEKLEAAERTRFRNGDSSLLFVNIREQFTADARLKEVEAQQDFHKALVTFMAAKADML